MTLAEARQMIGQTVEYRASEGSTPERGVITSVGEKYVYVRYGRDTQGQATHPNNLYPMEQQ